MRGPDHALDERGHDLVIKMSFELIPSGNLAAGASLCELRKARKAQKTRLQIAPFQRTKNLRTWQPSLRGISCLELEEVAPKRNNITLSRSFGQPVEDLKQPREAVAVRATRAGEKLRRQVLAASVVCVFLLTNRHRPDLLEYSTLAGRELLVPSSFIPELVGECQRILAAIYRPGYRYTKAGVHFLDLMPDDEKQASLFRPVDLVREKKERALMAAVDMLNLWGGSGTVRLATAGFRQKWQMRRDRMSPCYTTRLIDVPVARR